MYKDTNQAVVIGIIIVVLVCLFFGLGRVNRSITNQDNALNQHNQIIIEMMEGEVPAGQPQLK